MRNTFTKFFAATILCTMLAFGAMAGDISSGRSGDISSGRGGDISSGVTDEGGKSGDISSGKSMIKEDIMADVFRTLTGILLGD